MTDRREQWLRTQRQSYQSFATRFPVPARRLHESRTWPRHGPTARIASTVVRAASRRKEEKEEGELSSSDDDHASPSLKLTGSILGKGPRPSYFSSSRTTEKDQRHRSSSRTSGKEQQPRPGDAAASPVSTTGHPSRQCSIVDKAQLLSSVSARAPLITSPATVSVAQISSELAAEDATSLGPRVSTVVPNTQQNQATEQIKHIRSKFFSQPGQLSVPAKENAICNIGKFDPAKAQPVLSSPLSSNSLIVKTGGADLETSSVPAFGQCINQGNEPVRDNAVLQNGPTFTCVGTLLSASTSPSLASSAVSAHTSSPLTVKVLLAVPRATPTPVVTPRSSVEARSRPAQGAASAFQTSALGCLASVEARSLPAQGAASAFPNSGGNTLPTVIPARKEAESFLASLRIPLSPAAMCNLPAVEDKDEAFVINFDDSSESDGENRVAGAVFNRSNTTAAARPGSQPVQGSGHTGGQQVSNGAVVQKPAVLQSQIDQMKKQIAAMEQKGKPPIAPNSSKPYKSSYPSLHRQPHYVASAANGDGGKLESLRQTILQKENELEKERQRLGQISHAPRRSAPMNTITSGVAGKSGNASSHISPQKFRDASAGNTGGQQGRVGIPYISSAGHPAYTNTGGPGGTQKPPNPSDFEQRGPAGILYTPSWLSQKATAAPKITSPELPVNTSTVASRQKRARAEKLAHDIKRLEAQIGSVKGSPKVYQPQKRKQVAVSNSNNMQYNRFTFSSQAGLGRPDKRLRGDMELESSVAEEYRSQDQIDIDGHQSLWTSDNHLQDSSHTATSRTVAHGQVGYSLGPNSNVSSEVNVTTHFSEQGLVEPDMIQLTSGGLIIQTQCRSDGLDGRVYRVVSPRSMVRAEELYHPKSGVSTEAVGMETIPPSVQGEQLQLREAPYSQMSFEAVGDRHLPRHEGQFGGAQSQDVNTLQGEHPFLKGRNGIDTMTDVGYSNRQEDFMNLEQEEDLIDKELEEAQERRRAFEAQERTARRAYREAQRALQAVNFRCDYLHQRREKVAAQVRAAEIQYYSARALLQPPQFPNEGTVVSFDKDMSVKAPFFYSAPSTWTRAEPSTHQAANLLPSMGSMVGQQFSALENLHAGSSHQKYEGTGVIRPRESAQLQRFGASHMHHRDVGITNEVRSLEVLNRTHQAHPVAQSTGPMIQDTIAGTHSYGGAGDSIKAGRKRVTETSDQYELSKSSDMSAEGLQQNVLSTSQLVSTVSADSRAPTWRPQTQIKIPSESLTHMLGRKTSETPLVPESASLKIIDLPSRQEQGPVREAEAEEPAVVPVHPGSTLPDLQNGVSLSVDLAIPAKDDSGGDKTVLCLKAPLPVYEGTQHSSPLKPSFHINKNVKKRPRQRGGRAFHSLKARRPASQKFCSPSSSESPLGSRLSSAPEESETQVASAFNCAPVLSASPMVGSQAVTTSCSQSPLVAMQHEHLSTDLENTPGGKQLDIDSQLEKLDEITCSTHTESAQQQPVSGIDGRACEISVEVDPGGIDGIQSSRDGNAEPVVDSSPFEDLANQVGTSLLTKCQHMQLAKDCMDEDAKTSRSNDSMVHASCHEQGEDQTESAEQNRVQTVPHDSTITHASASESRNLDLELVNTGLVDVPYERELSMRTSVVNHKQCDNGDVGDDGVVGGDHDGKPVVACIDMRGLDVTEINDTDTKVLETSYGTQVLEDDIFMGSSASTEMLAGHAADVSIEIGRQRNISEVRRTISDYLVVSTFKGDLDLYVPSSALIVTFSCFTPGNKPLFVDNAMVNLQSISRKGLRKALVLPPHQQPWYTSPLSNFRSYRLFPWFNHSLESSTWSHLIDCFRPLCKFEHRGVCKDQECPLQHIRDYTMDLNQILSQLHGYIDAKMSEVSSVGQCHTGRIKISVEEHGDSGHPHTEASIIVAEAQEIGCSVMKPLRCQSWKWTSYVGHVPAYRMGSHLYKSDDTVAKGLTISRALPFSTLGSFQSYLLSPSASRPLPVNVPFLFEIGEKKGLFEKLIVNTPRWFDLADGEKQALAEVVPNDVELWLELALDLINFDVNVEEPDKKASALYVLSRTLEANSSSAVLWIVYLSIFYTTNGTEKDDLFKPAVDHSNCYELWRLFIDTRSELNERLESYQTALLRLGSLDETSTEKKNSTYLLDLTLQMLYCMIISGNIEMALSWIDNLVVDTSAVLPTINSSTTAVLTGLTVHDACILWVCCAYISAYSQLPSNIVSRFGCRQELPFDLHWKSQQVELVGRMTKLLNTAASGGLGCLSLDAINVSDDGAHRARQAFAVNYVQCLAVSLGVEAAVSYCHHLCASDPGCLELVVICARLEQQLQGTERGFGVFQDAVNRLQGTSGVFCLWNQYAGHALRWEGKEAALDVLGRCAACEHPTSKPEAGSSSSSISDSTVDASTKNTGNMQQIRASLSAITQRHLSTWVENAKGNRIVPGQDSVFSLLNLGLFEVLCGNTSAAQAALERALKTAANDKDSEHCWKALASFTIFNLGHDSELGDSCLLGRHMLDLLDRCFTEARLISKLESLSQLADTIKKRRLRSFVKNLLGSDPTNYCLLNDILYATYGPTILPGKSISFQSAASFAEGILELMPGNVVVALALCRLIAKVYDKSASVSSDAATVWASSLAAQALVKSCPPAPESQWVEAANFLRRTGESKAIEEFCQHALKPYPFSVALRKILEESS